jgi:hypothetical protein
MMPGNGRKGASVRAQATRPDGSIAPIAAVRWVAGNRQGSTLSGPHYIAGERIASAGIPTFTASRSRDGAESPWNLPEELLMFNRGFPGIATHLRHCDELLVETSASWRRAGTPQQV